MKKLLNRQQAAEYLSEFGLKISRQTMAIQAVRGTGPNYTLIGRKAYYSEEWLDEWLESQMTPHSHSLAHMLQNKEDAG